MYSSRDSVVTFALASRLPAILIGGTSAWMPVSPLVTNARSQPRIQWLYSHRPWLRADYLIRILWPTPFLARRRLLNSAPATYPVLIPVADWQHYGLIMPARTDCGLPTPLIVGCFVIGAFPDSTPPVGSLPSLYVDSHTGYRGLHC